MFIWRDSPQWAMASSFTRFLDQTQRRTTLGRTPLDEWSARRRDLYLTTHNTHNRQISMPQVGFEPTIPTGKRPQTYALDRAATGTGMFNQYKSQNLIAESYQLDNPVSRVYVKSKFAIMDPYLVRCLDGCSPLITFGVGVSVYKSLQRPLRWRISKHPKTKQLCSAHS